MNQWKLVGDIVHEVPEQRNLYPFPVAEIFRTEYARVILQAREMKALLQETFDLNRHEYRLPEHMDLAGVADDDPERAESAAHFEKRLALQSKIHAVLSAAGG